MYPYNKGCVIFMKTLFNYIEILETPYEKEHGELKRELTIFLMILKFSTERFKEITREHWNIECSLIGD